MWFCSVRQFAFPQRFLVVLKNYLLAMHIHQSNLLVEQCCSVVDGCVSINITTLLGTWCTTANHKHWFYWLVVRTKSPTVARIADQTVSDFQAHPKSMIFYLIWKSVCDFLLMINCNLGRITYRLRDMATYSFKHFIKNCDQTAAARDMITIDSL